MRRPAQHLAKQAKKRVGGHFRHYFIRGVYVILPLLLLWVIAKFLFDKTDGILEPLIHLTTGHYIVGSGFVLIVIITYLTGVSTETKAGKLLLHWLEQLLMHTPVVKNVFNIVKKLVEAFDASKASGPRKVVLVKYPSAEIDSIGILMGQIKVDGVRKMVVYIPTPPTLQSGVSAFVRPQDVRETDWEIEDLASFMFSLGAICPPETKTTQKE